MMSTVGRDGVLGVRLKQFGGLYLLWKSGHGSFGW